MSSYSSPHRTRGPKKKYPTRPTQPEDNEEGEDNVLLPPPITNFVPDVLPLLRMPESDEEKEEAYRRVIQLKMHRKTNKECGIALGVSERTINNWRKDPIYRDMEVDFIQQAKVGADLLVSDMAYTALKTLNDLMNPALTNSEFTRFSAAKTVGEWLGLNMPREEAHEDSREAVAAFLAKVEMEQPRVTINQTNIYTTSTTPNALPAPAEADPLIVEASKEEEEQVVDRWIMPTVLPGGKLPESW